MLSHPMKPIEIKRRKRPYGVSSAPCENGEKASGEEASERARERRVKAKPALLCFERRCFVRQNFKDGRRL